MHVRVAVPRAYCSHLSLAYSSIVFVHFVSVFPIVVLLPTLSRMHCSMRAGIARRADMIHQVLSLVLLLHL